MKLKFVSIIFLPIVFSFNLNLIEDYFNNLVEIKNVIVFSCSTSYNLQKLAVFLSNSNSYFKFISNSNFEDFMKIKAGKFVFLVDYSCSDSKLFLIKSSKFKYFNSSYHWIILNGLYKSSDEIFENIPNIGIDSNINLLSKIDVSTYEIFEVYSRGLHLGAPVTVKKFGLWSKGFKFLNQKMYFYNRKNRGNLNGIQLIDGIVKNHGRHNSEVIYHKEVNSMLMQMFNFKYGPNDLEYFKLINYFLLLELFTKHIKTGRQ